MARSGFVVYEGGNSVFNESVLVYLARRGQWPDFDVCDHVGRPLAYARSERGNSVFQTRNPTVYYDPGMNQILRIRPNFLAFNMSFDVSGVANAQASSGVGRTGQLVMRANNEPFGSIRGPTMQGLAARSLKIIDEQNKQVGVVRSFRDGGLLSRFDHYVMSIEPGLGGELRRLLIGVPTMVATIARQQRPS